MLSVNASLGRLAHGNQLHCTISWDPEKGALDILESCLTIQMSQGTVYLNTWNPQDVNHELALSWRLARL